MIKMILALILATALAVPGFAEVQKPLKGQMTTNPHKGMGTGSGYGYGYGYGYGKGMGSMDRMENMVGMCLAHIDQMGLSGEQLAKIKPIRREMLRKQVQFKAERKLAEMDLAEIMSEKDFDLEKASTAVKRISDIKTRHHLEMLKYIKQVHNIMPEGHGMMTTEEGDGEDDEE